ncbi:MAG: RNB domain-containing ribonuclease, partial [Deltaproteobacteria bacterium]|nr:RNB domain-containing ribonuclease [Deltaproteobacteria bacterium]
EFVKDKPYEKIFNRVLLRSFKLARYSPENPGHFGLGFHTYTHFTSPIRRYPDLMVHRALKFTLGDKKYGKHLEVIEKDLARIGDHLSKREKDAEQAERDVVDKLKALYMVGREGEQYAGLITSVHPFGFFIALEDVFVEGLVHINDLPEDVYYMNSAGFTLAGRYFGKTFSVGNRVHIRVKESDPLKGRVDLLLVEKGQQKKYNEVKIGRKRGKNERKNSYRRR